MRNLQSWEYDRLISKAMEAIAEMCEKIDWGESFKSVAKRTGLSQRKVENVYRVRNKRLLSAVEGIIQSTCRPVTPDFKVRKRSVRKTTADKVLGTRNKRQYIDSLIKEIKGEVRQP